MPAMGWHVVPLAHSVEETQSCVSPDMQVARHRDPALV